MDAANEMFQAVSDSVQLVPGFISRQVLVSEKDPMKVTAINSWQSKEAFQKWMQALGAKFAGTYTSEWQRRVFAKVVTESHTVTKKSRVGGLKRPR